MSPPNNAYMQPGSEVTKVDYNVSPAGAQARAAATQTDMAAPQGTVRTEPSQASSPVQTSPSASSSSSSRPIVPSNSESYMQPGTPVNTIAHHISPAGAQARAAALQTDFSAPAGTVRTEAFGEAPGAPTHSPMGISPDVNIPSPVPSYARAAEPAEYKPVDALNTAREVFQPTSANQPGAFEHAAQQQQMPPQQSSQQQYAAPSYTYTPTPAPQPNYAPPSQQFQQQPEKPYSFSPQQPKQNFNYTYQPQQSTQTAPFNSASSVNPQTQSYSPQHSAGGAMARTAAMQTSSSAPAGTRSAATVSPMYRSVSELARGAGPYQPQSYPSPSVSSAPAEVPKFSAMAPSPGMVARAAAQKGVHPAGTGTDAGVIGTANFAAQKPTAPVEVSDNFSPAGAAARAAAAGEAPRGTGATFAKHAAASQEVKYQAPAAQIHLSPEDQVSPAGMQARQLAYGAHPAGTGPGSVPGRRFSTMAGPARRVSASAVMPRIKPTGMGRKGSLVVGAAAAAGLLFSS